MTSPWTARQGNVELGVRGGVFFVDLNGHQPTGANAGGVQPIDDAHLVRGGAHLRRVERLFQNVHNDVSRQDNGVIFGALGQKVVLVEQVFAIQAVDVQLHHQIVPPCV